MQFESVVLDSVLGWHWSSAFETSSRVMPGLLDHRPHFQYQHFLLTYRRFAFNRVWVFLGSVSSVSLSPGRLASA